MARTKIRSPTLGDCHLYDAATGQDLILDGSSAQVLIADIHASVNLSQRFTNTSYTTISSAVYTFGLMAGAPVCRFEMIRQDGTRVEGVVKEKEAAMKELSRPERLLAWVNKRQKTVSISFFSNADKRFLTSFPNSVLYHGRKCSSFRDCRYQLTLHSTTYG